MKKHIKVVLGLIISLAAVLLPAKFTMADTTTGTVLRSQVEQRALNMINFTWTYDSSKNSIIAPLNSAYVTQPKQFIGQTISTEIGIPYCWGGSDSLDSASYGASWTNFKDAISNGAYAGNVNADAARGYISGTAGLDCSGFVQASYNIPGYKLSTSTLFNKYFTKIDLSHIKHMDILNYPGNHVVIFDKWGTFNGISGAFTYEATPDQTYGGIMGTKKYFISMNK